MVRNALQLGLQHWGVLAREGYYTQWTLHDKRMLHTNSKQGRFRWHLGVQRLRWPPLPCQLPLHLLLQNGELLQVIIIVRQRIEDHGGLRIAVGG